MSTERTVFSQVMDYLPMHEFRKCVNRYCGNYKVRSFTCHEQFLSMAFAQLTYRQSLRDIEACLRAVQPKLYHMGIRSRVARSTLAQANEKRDWRIYADFAQVLIGQARKLYAHDDFGLQLDQTAYALDSTTIDLCLSLFPWATYQKTQGAVKLHTLLDFRGNIPSLIVITHGKVHDVRILDQLPLEPGAIYVMDRGYVDYSRLYRFQLASAYFVIRARNNTCFRRLYSHRVDKNAGLRSDQTIVLTGVTSHKDYPEKLRRVRCRDEERRRSLVFLTNHFQLPAKRVADLFRSRWQVELFFKWIKQHLRIKSFYGATENAVKSQIWIAITVYVLVAIMKRRLNLDLSLYNILQVLSITLLERIPILQAFREVGYNYKEGVPDNQLFLFN